MTLGDDSRTLVARPDVLARLIHLLDARSE
jgi:hypothetical protein